MSTEPEHLAQLRASLEALKADRGDDQALREAVEVLLRVAIAHHESVGLGVGEEQVPAFMEAGDPVAAPVIGSGAPSGV